MQELSNAANQDALIAGAEQVSNQPKSVSVLGATGSVGESSLDILCASPERYRVRALTANSNVAKLAEAARASGASYVAIGREAAYQDLKDALADTDIEVGAGLSGLVEAASVDADVVIGAIVGAAGIEPTMAALKAGNQIALANKEALVCAGDLFMEEARQLGKPILPVDSEHNAIFQIFEDGNRDAIEEVTITASGGPFRTWDKDAIDQATPDQALKHPNWDMGAKITIDSASMMNKGLELIEAHHLYGLGAEKLRVVVHPQSVIHGLVTYSDGSMLAHMGAPDMRIPIAHCLAWPQRAAANTHRLSLIEVGQMTFEAPDPDRFPCLRLAWSALEAGGSLPNILNAANEVAVDAFLNRQIKFGDIARIVEATMEQFVSAGRAGAVDTIAQVLTIDEEARQAAMLHKAKLG